MQDLCKIPQHITGLGLSYLKEYTQKPLSDPAIQEPLIAIG